MEVFRVLSLVLGWVPLRMWEGLGLHHPRDLTGLPECGTLLGRPEGREELLELSSDQKALVPLPAVPKRNLAPWLRAISAARRGLRSAMRPTRMALEEARMGKHSTSLWNCGT